jgi:hypothetical protein
MSIFLISCCTWVMRMFELVPKIYFIFVTNDNDIYETVLFYEVHNEKVSGQIDIDVIVHIQNDECVYLIKEYQIVRSFDISLSHF